MRYIVTVGEARFEVEVSGDQVTLGDKTVTARLEPLGDTPLRVLHVDGTAWSLAMRHDVAGWAVQHGGRTRALEVVDERTHSIRSLTAGAAGAQAVGVVRAPMPGMVLRLEVEEGQRVSRGDGLLVLEAMKMENELRAPGDATVTRVYAVPGMAVEKGAVLVELGPAS